MYKMPLFSIVVPNWNGKKFLDRCFKSLYEQTLKDFEIILVDNGSRDNSIEWTKKYHPKIKILGLKENYGFAKAANEGIRISKGEFIVLLNNDAEADDNWLQEIKKAADNETNASSFASKMLDYKDRDIVDSCGIGLTWTGRSFNLGMGEKDSDKFRTNKFVFGACGGAAIYRKELFDDIGFFDEDYFMYMEDVDFSYRAQAAGHKCLFVAKARVYHYGAASSGGKNSAFAFKLCMRNRWLFMYKNFSSRKIWVNLFQILYSEMRYFGSSVRDHSTLIYFQAIGSAFKNLSKFRKKRSQLKDTIKVPPRYLDEIIAKKFLYKTFSEAFRKQ